MCARSLVLLAVGQMPIEPLVPSATFSETPEIAGNSACNGGSRSNDLAFVTRLRYGVTRGHDIAQSIVLVSWDSWLPMLLALT